MEDLQTIPLLNLSIILLPVIVVIGILYRWSVESGAAAYSIARMITQLLLIGYLLTWIFSTQVPGIVLGLLTVMLLAAAWISLRPLQQKSRQIYFRSLAAIALGGITTLTLIIVAVLDQTPWYAPHVIIPLGGMIFANAMNTVSIAAERFESEIGSRDYFGARRQAVKAAMIPQINTMFAVGLVSLPGTMTGQILAGVSPLIAVRWQIMVMCMIFGSAGISVACYLWSLKNLNRPIAASTPEPK